MLKDEYREYTKKLEVEGYREGRFVAFSLTKKGKEVAKKLK